MSKILAIDYGTKRIGLAISDAQNQIAFPFLVLENKNSQEVLEKIKEICLQKSVEKIILGWPLNLSGEATHSTSKTQIFFELLKKNIELPIILFDERFSSKSVEKSLSESKKNIDARAAAIILQDYLDSQK